MSDEKTTLRAKSDPSIEVSGISDEECEYFFHLFLAPDTPSTPFDKDYWERVITLPVDFGAVFHAKVNGEEYRIIVTASIEPEDQSIYFATNKDGETFWFRAEDIDPDTIQTELEGLE